MADVLFRTERGVTAPHRPPRTPSVHVRPSRRVVRRGLSFAGVIGAVLCFCLSLTPSLLPRHWALQGVVSGITMAIGYGIGATAGAMVRRLWRRVPAVRDRHWTVLGGGGLVLATGFLSLGSAWQSEVRALVGMPPAPGWEPALIVAIALVLALLLLLVARSLRLATRAIARRLSQVVPTPLAVVVSALVVVVGVGGFGQGVLFTGFVDLAGERASSVNAIVDAAVAPPDSPYRSGGPGSLVTWQSLGAAGREFVSGATPVDELAAFATDGDAIEPIRVYAGLDSAPTAAERADLAVRELERTGGLDRAAIGVITTTGTGWVNPDAARALEYLYAGDTALVATQYSYLPSWISFLTDRSRAAEAATALIDAVRARLDRMPAGERPRLVLYGESLGAHATEHAFDDLAELAATTDGVLLAGPPYASQLWRTLTRQRDPDSPIWRPVYAGGESVRFAQTPADLRVSAGSRPSVVFLQNASDPIVWWGPELLYRPPAWLGAERGPDVSGAMRWYPVVTFWQVTVDLLASTQVPDGHGHSYGASLADAWAAMIPPPGWSQVDTERLRAVLG